MKRSETYRQYAREVFFTGVILLVIGFLWLVAVGIAFAAGAETKVGWIMTAAPALVFFGGSAWAFFVEYPFDKQIQRGVEEEEAQEEQVRQHTASR